MIATLPYPSFAFFGSIGVKESLNQGRHVYIEAVCVASMVFWHVQNPYLLKRLLDSGSRLDITTTGTVNTVQPVVLGLTEVGFTIRGLAEAVKKKQAQTMQVGCTGSVRQQFKGVAM